MSYNSTFIANNLRNMNCPVCGVTQSVAQKIGGSAEASRNKLRLTMIDHLRALHGDSRSGKKFLAKFGADILAPTGMNVPADEQRIRDLVQEALDGFGNDGNSGGLDADEVRAMVAEEVAKVAGPRTLTVKQASGKVLGTIKTFHRMLSEAVRTVDAGFDNMLLVGPAGTGKSTLGHQLAKALKLDFGFISLTSGVTEGALVGRLSSDGRYIPARFVEMYENGGVFLLDEVDAADPNVLLVLNAALDSNRMLAVPSRVKKPIAHRHENFVLVCAANTWGLGADWQYVGRNQLDAAFLSRFAGAVLEVGYDETLEREKVTPEWHEVFLAVRRQCAANKVRRVMGTRELMAGFKLLKGGYSPEETWARLTAGWTADEKRKAAIPSTGAL
jgi:MoxR-like ATPase